MNPDRLLEWLASVSDDPYAFVMGAYPWGVEGSRLEKETGPNDWQTNLLCRVRDRLCDLTQAILEATASGHGVGKSACVAWLLDWAKSTLPDTRGVVTANTEQQLKGKTWAEIGKWHHMSITKDLFTLTATSWHSSDPAHERTWRIDMVPWSEHRPEAFAGLHNKGRRLIIIFDEASAIADKIWETTEGALTDADTQIIWCVFGNPTKNSGRFKECFKGGRFAKMWHSTSVDSRTIPFTNKTQISTWGDAYGDDSDFFRIRVKGEFPRHGEMEFFSTADVEEAMTREVNAHYTDPLALGVDVARFGANFSVLYPRKGRDARTTPRQRYQGVSTTVLASHVFATATGLRADGVMVDGGGVGGGVVDNCRQMHLNVFEVQFGAKNSVPDFMTGSQGEKYANMRAGMYGALRAWIKTGAIPNDPDLKDQFLGITYTFNNRDEIVLTSKEQMMKDGLPSPDDLDALAMTFAIPLQAHEFAGGEFPAKDNVQWDYNPYAPERMVA